MRASGALPSEKRTQDMNSAQWLWYYFNLEEDMVEDRDRSQNRLDYLGMYINPKLAKVVSEQNEIRKRRESGRSQKERNKRIANILKSKGSNSAKVEEKELEDIQSMAQEGVVSTEFDKELERAMKESGASMEDVYEVPDENSAGNAAELEEDFLERVKAFAPFAGTDYGYQKPERRAVNINRSGRNPHIKLSDGEYLPPEDENKNEGRQRLNESLQNMKSQDSSSNQRINHFDTLEDIANKSSVNKPLKNDTNDTVEKNDIKEQEHEEIPFTNMFEKYQVDKNKFVNKSSTSNKSLNQPLNKSSNQSMNSSNTSDGSNENLQIPVMREDKQLINTDSNHLRENINDYSQEKTGHLPPEGLTDDMDYFDYDDD